MGDAAAKLSALDDAGELPPATTTRGWSSDIIRGMATMAEVSAAEARMRNAQADLLAYTERPAGEPADIPRHRRLADALKAATDEYVRLLSELEH